MAHRLRRRAMALLCRTRLYRYTLTGRTPREFVKNLAIRWPGDGKRGAALLAGNFQLAGETVRLAAPYAAPEEAGTDWPPAHPPCRPLLAPLPRRARHAPRDR